MDSNHANPNIKESLSLEEIQLVEQFYQYSYRKSLDLTRNRWAQGLDEFIYKKKVTESAKQIKDSSNNTIPERQLTRCKTFQQHLNHSRICNHEKEEAHEFREKVSLTLKNSKLPKDNISKNERKTLKEF